MDRTKVTKILRNLCLRFARQDGQDGKNRKENHTTKVTKIPKSKRQKYGMNETKVTKIPKTKRRKYGMNETLIYQIQQNFRFCKAFVNLAAGVGRYDLHLELLGGHSTTYPISNFTKYTAPFNTYNLYIREYFITNLKLGQ